MRILGPISRPPGNRFYPALQLAGIIKREIDRGVGMSVEDRRHLLDRGIGITNVAHRATAKASELSRQELIAGGEVLRAIVRTHRPQVVAIAGVTAYRIAFAEPNASNKGEHPAGFEGRRLWVVPNPSGLNTTKRSRRLRRHTPPPLELPV